MTLDLIQAGILTLLILATMAASNFAHARGAPFYISRKVAHIGSAIPIVLLPLFYEEFYFPLALIGSFGLILFTFRFAPDIFSHGFARKERLSEVYFPISIFIGIAVLWNESPWIAILPGLFLALGDGVTGLVRMHFVKREKKDWTGSVACLIVCFSVAAFVVSPLVAIISSSVATIAERYAGDAEGALVNIDDNLAMPLSALVVLALFAIGPL